MINLVMAMTTGIAVLGRPEKLSILSGIDDQGPLPVVRLLWRILAAWLLHLLRAGIGTERNSARPPPACLESEVQQTRIEAVRAG